MIPLLKENISKQILQKFGVMFSGRPENHIQFRAMFVAYLEESKHYEPW